MNNHLTTCDRFIVFLDIMGFKDRVARTTHDELYKLLTDFNKDLTNIINSSKRSSSIEEPTEELEGQVKIHFLRNFHPIVFYWLNSQIA